MTQATPLNENFARDIKALVLSMPVAQMLQLRFERMEPGEVELSLPYQDALSFRPGQLQATPIFAIARIAGWSAHRLEELATAGKIIRPAYKSVAPHVPYVPMQQRKERELNSEG